MKSMQLYHAGTKIETLNGKTTITVDGKDVNLNSPEGRKILRDVAKRLVDFDKIIDSVMLSAEKIRKTAERIFEI